MKKLTDLLREIKIKLSKKPYQITPDVSKFKTPLDDDTLTSYLNSQDGLALVKVDKYKLIQYKENSSILTNIKVRLDKDIWDEMNRGKNININEDEVYKQYIVTPATQNIQSVFNKLAGLNRIKVVVFDGGGWRPSSVRLVIPKDSPDNFKMKV